MTTGADIDDDDRRVVAELLGRVPLGDFRVAVRDEAGVPVVIENAPLLADGTPMPTRYWLVDRAINRRIGRLESIGGVRAAEAAVDPVLLSEAHRRYAAERDALIPGTWTGPRPSGGVGGTRRGVKCLHTHYAWFLAGGEDPVGQWVDRRLDDNERSTGVAQEVVAREVVAQEVVARGVVAQYCWSDARPPGVEP